MRSEEAHQLAKLTGVFVAGVAAAHLYRTHLSPTLTAISASSRRIPPLSLLAAVELGGTSCRAAIAHLRDPTQIVHIFETPTTDPSSTLSRLHAFLEQHTPFVALGAASFGPVDLDKASETYGYITNTNKEGWQNVNLLDGFARYNVPVGFDTDVNAPAMAEVAYGDGEGESCAYVTVGTGIGVGLVVNGAPVHGLMHPEAGHINTLRKADDAYEGCNKLHRESIESFACAKACAERAEVDVKQLAELDDEAEVWDDVAYYLAQLCLTLCYVASPHYIVLSGGVLKRGVLFGKIREWFAKLNEGYVAHEKVIHRLEEYIRPSKFGNEMGIIGALELARRALIDDREQGESK